jgi:hypothetical protein
MVDLYEYDTATEEECLEDLEELINNITCYYDYETLESKGLRLQYIAQRLQELGVE